MNWSTAIRQFHRWMSMAFTATFVIVSVVVAAGAESLEWMYFLPLGPLAFLFLTGLYLFVLPHSARWRGAHVPWSERDG